MHTINLSRATSYRYQRFAKTEAVYAVSTNADISHAYVRTHPVILVGGESIKERFDFLGLLALGDLVVVGNPEECGSDLGQPFRFNDCHLVHVLLCPLVPMRLGTHSL